MGILGTTVLVLTLAGIVVPALATTMSEAQRTCPVGGETYASFEINSTSRFGTRLDLRPIGPAASLPWIECPNGFIVFKEEESFTPQEIETLTALVADPAFQEARTTHVPAYRAYLQHRALGADEGELAFALLYAAWEAEDAGKAEQRTAYLRDALAGFERWGATLPAGGEQWWSAALVGAEIRRQLGDFAGATAAVDALPTTGRAPDDVMRQVADQIRGLAEQRQAAPAEFTPPGQSSAP